MENINFLKFIELCFKTMMPGYEYNDYQYMKIIADRLEAASTSEVGEYIQHATALNEIPVRQCCMARMDTWQSANRENNSCKLFSAA